MSSSRNSMRFIKAMCLITRFPLEKTPDTTSIFSSSFSLLSSQRGKDQQRPLAGALESHCPLVHQVHHLALQLLDNLFRTLDRG